MAFHFTGAHLFITQKSVGPLKLKSEPAVVELKPFTMSRKILSDICGYFPVAHLFCWIYLPSSPSITLYYQSVQAPQHYAEESYYFHPFSKTIFENCQVTYVSSWSVPWRRLLNCREVSRSSNQLLLSEAALAFKVIYWPDSISPFQPSWRWSGERSALDTVH